jgi:thioredoxin reductase
MKPDNLPVAVIGGGPVGLAAAAHLISRNIPVKLYEAGDTVAASVQEWGHVRLFSPWKYNTDEVASALLRQHGWQEPPGDGLPTGGDLYDAYLRPLAETPELKAVIETGATVQAITRDGVDKVVSSGREAHPFSLVVQNGVLRVDHARAVIDASGTWRTPSPMGASGLPAIGEREAARYVTYGLPDAFGKDRSAYKWKRVLITGGGHSAANVLLDLARIAERDAPAKITWAVRSKNLARVFGGGAADQLPARGKLGSDLKALTDSGRLEVITGFYTKQVAVRDNAVTVTGDSERGATVLGPFDQIIVATGQRPDLDLTRELRLDLDPWLECARKLGPEIDPNLHSCGSVPPHGYRELSHPEPGFFTVGVKSYGRAPTFLMATGYEQVRSVAAYLAGDIKAADDVRLVLPETGVCSTDLNNAAAEGCCGGPSAPEVDACCVKDAEAKQAGASGCGCGSQAKPAAAKAKEACCG